MKRCSDRDLQSKARTNESSRRDRTPSSLAIVRVRRGDVISKTRDASRILEGASRMRESHPAKRMRSSDSEFGTFLGHETQRGSRACNKAQAARVCTGRWKFDKVVGEGNEPT